MPDIIDKLQQDHKNIAKLLRLLEKQLKKFEAGDYTNYQILTDIMHYFVNYPDVYHHPHEEIIFSALKKKDINVADVVDEISTEHKTMNTETEELYDEFIKIQGNAIYSREEIASRLRNFISHYYRHIDIEENKLFKTARKILEDDDWRMIEAEAAKSDDPLFDKVMNDEYQALYQIILSENGEPEKR